MTKKKRKIKPQAPAIPRLRILQAIGDCFQQMVRWSRFRRYDSVFTGAVQAEVLIELLEVADCGSTGGFDKDQPESDLLSRWVWLFRKYHHPEGMRFGSGTVSFEEICEWWNKQDPTEQSAQ